jgi:hypothetical protein
MYCICFPINVSIAPLSQCCLMVHVTCAINHGKERLAQLGSSTEPLDVIRESHSVTPLDCFNWTHCFTFLNLLVLPCLIKSQCDTCVMGVTNIIVMHPWQS